MIKNLKNRIPFLRNLSRQRKLSRFKKRYIEWKADGGTLPMPHYGKKLALEEYVTRFKPEIFIETGTYTGHMVLSMLDKFQQVYSVELDQRLYQKAAEMFSGYKHVQILQGESDKVLRKLLPEIKAPCLFWLDAHYSMGQTAKAVNDPPITDELSCILNHPLMDWHIILIDDARNFNGTNGYPEVEALKTYILENHPNWVFEVKDDIIRTYAKRN